ncbi:MAG: cytochrome-c oxidase, cbb3-type subunit III [Magnetococcales bacterium]|nr:cytochrome-c oxidase, cbb3-type subunit III [Magnetococcales bacterium]
MSDNQEVSTTGHQWDDEEGYPLQEYNNPLPKWWLYSFYATIIWAVIYWILYPAWPIGNGFTKGVLGWSMHKELREEMDEANAKKKVVNEQLASMPLQEIAKKNDLLQYAISGGKAIFGDNCAPCHGQGGIGSKAGGFPNLTDDDWLYGGNLETIEATITQGRTGQMPAHLKAAGGAFDEAQVNDLTQYVLSFSGRSQDAAASKRGDALFHGEAGCNGCHGDQGNGSLKGTMAGQALPPVGAPNLTDAIWLHGADPVSIRESIAKGRMGVMPAWGKGSKEVGRQLDPLAIKQVTLYVHSLGGGR